MAYKEIVYITAVYFQNVTSNQQLYLMLYFYQMLYVLIKLHWLPIKFRIQFKVLLLVYKALNGLAPKYIKELLVPYKPRRHLRSEAKGLLDDPRTRLKFGDRAFSIRAPRLWNALPQHLKDYTSCQAFKKCLKTPFQARPLRHC